MRQQVLLNYGARLAIAAWGAGEHRLSPSWFGFSLSNARRVLVHSAIGAALGTAFVLALTATRKLSPRDDWERRIAGIPPLKALVLFNLTGLTEEAIWRGWTFSEIEEVFAGRSARARAAAAICGSAFLFSAVHLLNVVEGPRRGLVPELQQLAMAGAVGLIAAYWRQATGSIVPGIVLHDVLNLLLYREIRRALLYEQGTGGGALSHV